MVYATHQDAMVASPLSSPGMLDIVGGGSGSGSSGEESPVELDLDLDLELQELDVDCDVDIEGMRGGGGGGRVLHVFPEGFEPGASVAPEYTYGYAKARDTGYGHGAYAHQTPNQGGGYSGAVEAQYGGNANDEGYARAGVYGREEELRSRTESPSGGEVVMCTAGTTAGTAMGATARGMSIDNAELFAGSQVRVLRFLLLLLLYLSLAAYAELNSYANFAVLSTEHRVLRSYHRPVPPSFPLFVFGFVVAPIPSIALFPFIPFIPSTPLNPPGPRTRRTRTRPPVVEAVEPARAERGAGARRSGDGGGDGAGDDGARTRAWAAAGVRRWRWRCGVWTVIVRGKKMEDRPDLA